MVGDSIDDFIDDMLVEHELFDILRGFASLQAPKYLKWPKNISTVKIHNFLLDSVLLNSHFASYPPSAQYRRAFWKWAIEKMECALTNSQKETDEFEIDERMYGHYLGLLGPSGPNVGSSNPEDRSQICGRGLPLHQNPPSGSYVTHYWRPQSLSGQSCRDSQKLVDLTQYQTATLFESRRIIESGTTGLRTWRASFILAQYLIRHPDMTRPKRVLELGSGVGFLGIIVAALQIQCSAAVNEVDAPGFLYLTDINDDVLSRCQDNLRIASNLSSKHSNLHVQTLDWFASLDESQRSTLISLLGDDIKPDIILGADIVFDPSLIPALVGVLKIVLLRESGSGQRYALISLTVRNESTVNAFVTQIRGSSLRIEEIQADTDQSFFLEPVDVSPIQESVKLFKITTQWRV